MRDENVGINVQDANGKSYWCIKISGKMKEDATLLSFFKIQN